MMMMLFIVSLLLSVTYFHLICGGQQCPNATTTCNVNQVLLITENCSKCICAPGSYQDHGLGVCQLCEHCDYPYVIQKNCTQTSNTLCATCEKTYYHTKSGCKKCQECEHGVLMACGKIHDTVCAPEVTTPTTGTEKSTTILKLMNGNRADNGTGKDWKCNPIWYILSIMEFVILFIVILMCVICWNYRRRLYTRTDTSSLATSLSSLMLTKSKCPDITALTEQERETLIRVLPGGYADSLGQLLNPNVPNNWVQLAYEFRLTLTEIANRRENPDCMQDLLLYLGTKNTTVEMLWRALKNMKRDDACGTFVNFILNLRKDNESAIMLI